MRRPSGGSGLYVAAALLWLASSLLHDPGLGGLYSDIVSVYNRVFAEHRGWSCQAPLPYCCYHFEYPPLVGLMWLASSALSLGLGGGVRLHYWAMAAMLLPFYLLYAREALRLSRVLGVPAAALLALPSLVVYGVYNWDLAASALTLLGLRLALERRLRASAEAYAAAAAVKLFPGAAALAIAREEASMDTRRGLRFIAVFAAASLLLWLPMLACPRGLRGFLEHHSNWYIEGSWWLLVAGDPWSSWAREAAKAAMAAGLAAALLLPIRGAPRSRRLASRVFLSLALPLLGSYVYTPQMNLLVAPLALLAAPGLAPLVLLQDAAASTVILVWFSTGNPLERFSPASIASYVKCALLAVVALRVAWRGLRGETD